MAILSIDSARHGPVMLTLLCSLSCSMGDCLSRSDLTRVEENDGYFRHVGTMKDGKKHGQWLTYSRGILFVVEHWVSGKRHGLSRMFHDNGHLMSDTSFVNGVMDGRLRIFHEDGQIAEISWYNHGDRERTWCEWHPDGRLKRIAEYASDKLIREELDPPGTCPLLTGDGKRHLDARDVDDW